MMNIKFERNKKSIPEITTIKLIYENTLAYNKKSYY
jgi:hypothetical protein